jgi:hypothetical protein
MARNNKQIVTFAGMEFSSKLLEKGNEMSHLRYWEANGIAIGLAFVKTACKEQTGFLWRKSLASMSISILQSCNKYLDSISEICSILQ